MPNPQTFVVRPVHWTSSRNQLRAIRRAVFIEEQHVPEELEWDAADPNCYHVLAITSDGKPIGTGRLLLDGHIGRMAVLKEWRGKGVGSAIIEKLLSYARMEKFEKVELHAQIHALGFYRKHGFTAIGKKFLEAGIPHRCMEIHLRTPEGKSSQKRG